jgi:hypothetical protein
MNRRPVFSLIATLVIWLSLALTFSISTFAQDEKAAPPVPADASVQAVSVAQPSYTDARVVRLSFAQGDVQYQRADEDWQPASVNLPIQQGFRLATTDGRAEVQFESGLILRLAENSILEFTQLDTQDSGRITKLNLTQGTIIVTADLRPTDLFSVDAPNVHVIVAQPTRFRIDTTQGDSWVGVFAGDVLAKSETGETKVTNGHTFHISGADVTQVSIDMNAPLDDFDRWASDRDRSIQQGYRDSIQYVANYAPDYSEYSYGLSDLSSYGHWVVVAGSGLCWEPYGVPDHWRPFFNGSWEFFRRTGWTWISFEPWGWLPFHTGHWFPAPGGRWAWQPGPIRKWNPAPVHWFTVGNQLGWAPTGTLNSHGQPLASGIVVGTREERGTRIRPGVREPLPTEIAGRVTPTVPPTPVLKQREFRDGKPTEHVPPARPVNFPSEGTVRFDPATRTYVNSHPESRPVQPFRPRGNDDRGMDVPVQRQQGQQSPANPKPAQPNGAVGPSSVGPQFRPKTTGTDQPPAQQPASGTVPPARPTPTQQPAPPERPTQMQRPVYVPPAQPQQPAPQPHYVPPTQNTPPAQQAPRYSPPSPQPHASTPPPATPPPAASSHTPPPSPATAPTAAPIHH